jgi:arabinoxylan arabinofuranohydrolase
MKLFKLFLTLLGTLLIIQCSPDEDKTLTGYLFAYFEGSGEGLKQEQLRFAVSDNAKDWYSINGNQPIMPSIKISQSGGVRDPHLLRGHDGGGFYMVATDMFTHKNGWGHNPGIAMLYSDDLLNWEHAIVDLTKDFSEKFSNAQWVWAPQTIYDPREGKYLVYFTVKYYDDDRLDCYAAYANEWFNGFESEPKLLFQSKYGAIDYDIIWKDNRYNMFYKGHTRDENGREFENGIQRAASESLWGPWKEDFKYLDVYAGEPTVVEGSSVFKLNDVEEYILMYDLYASGRFEFQRSTDLISFTDSSEEFNKNFHPRHGSVIGINSSEMDRLVSKWLTFGDVVVGVNGTGVKINNVNIDVVSQSIYIPVVPETDLQTFEPTFDLFPGATIHKLDKGNFSDDAIQSYVASVAGKKFEFDVSVTVEGNPVLSGYYADPEIIYSEKESKYYIYPTSDGYHGWSGRHFETFSSTDLINWESEGEILDLTEEVNWADRNAWAPTCEEKLIDGEYRYYYYYTAAQKIGVAVSDNPSGPFIDSGSPLIDFKPKGINRGQEIDPDIFTDPQSGRSYLYWGNGYLAVVELNEDMVSIDKSTIKTMTPDRTFREGVEVFYRKGTYYFLWSEDDTRSPNYRVRYATTTTPIGSFQIPDNNIVIEKHPSKGIYGTGHNSVINRKGTDEWFIVYHRFNRPKGIEMGDAAGFNREVCIDKLEFNEDGSIRKVIPTLGGIALAQ